MAKHPASKPTRPMIGLNMDYLPAGKNGSAQLRVHAGYADAIYQAGGMPIIISPALKDRDLEDIMSRLDGFLLTSGPLDMDPRRLGMNPHPAVQPMPARREEFDRALCKIILDRQMPVLAVSLGMLELNVVAGGSIFLHLPSDSPKTFPHKDLTGGVHRHLVLLEPGTRLDAIYGGTEVRVNSYHQQAVNQLAPGFKIAAKASDGVIEAFESVERDWYCIGVQWHPHSETASALDMQLFESFVQACTRKEMALQLAA